MNAPLAANDHIPPPAPCESVDDFLTQQNRAWHSQPLPALLLNSIPEIILVLNASQHVVFANEAALNRLKVTDAGGLGGLSWGNVLGCPHSLNEGGCGAMPFCRTCGALKAIKNGLMGIRDAQECRILTSTGVTLELQATATPLDFGPDRYVICTLTDIGAKKRCLVLEKLFFHDVTNTAVGLKGLANLLMEAESKTPSTNTETSVVRNMIVNTATTLVEQIQSQRLLTVAENNDLSVSVQLLNSLEFLRGIAAKWQEQADMRQLNLVVNPDSISVRFSSDEMILSHVLNSMVKNAFEASSRGMKIALGCYAEDQAVVFRIHTSPVMAEDVQLQLFQRGFSTKGSGRGIGTYSMKLLTERYLGGKVGFKSEPDSGTVFHIRLPLILPVKSQDWNP